MRTAADTAWAKMRAEIDKWDGGPFPLVNIVDEHRPLIEAAIRGELRGELPPRCPVIGGRVALTDLRCFGSVGHQGEHSF